MKFPEPPAGAQWLATNKGDVMWLSLGTYKKKRFREDLWVDLVPPMGVYTQTYTIYGSGGGRRGNNLEHAMNIIADDMLKKLDKQESAKQEAQNVERQINGQN